MSIESSLFALLGPLVGGRCYPDVMPDNPTFPLIIYQVVGGQAMEWLDRTLPETENYRVQIECWSKIGLERGALALSARQKIIEEGAEFASAETLGQSINQNNSTLKIYGSRQDFSIWIHVR
ncbi:DUF3168 domain-containing protein [Castellaniella hirudinis]|uniref:tail completion protein gp17 n=1 Tax=Castellaniella hirudinis TaxID=1144617 RepID=UPI0039C3580F